MAIKLIGKNKPLDAGQISALEARLGSRFPASYRNFLQQNNVVKPDLNQFKQGAFSTSVSVFFGISGEPYEDLLTQNEAYSARLPDDLFPIPSAAAANLVTLHKSTVEVFFWHHVAEAGDDEQVTYNTT